MNRQGITRDSAAFKRAFAKARKTRPDRKRCRHGHDLTNPMNVHVTDLLRDKVINCSTCWEKANARYVRRKKVAAKQVNAAPKIGRTAPAGLAAQIQAAERIVKQLEIPQLLKVAAPGQRVMTLIAAKAANLAAAPRKPYAAA